MGRLTLAPNNVEAGRVGRAMADAFCTSTAKVSENAERAIGGDDHHLHRAIRTRLSGEVQRGAFHVGGQGIPVHLDRVVQRIALEVREDGVQLDGGRRESRHFLSVGERRHHEGAAVDQQGVRQESRLDGVGVAAHHGGFEPLPRDLGQEGIALEGSAGLLPGDGGDIRHRGAGAAQQKRKDGVGWSA
jgi:hypothetical protein